MAMVINANSTESALLRVLNDILLATDTGDSVVLVLLDLSAAFDTINHSVLINRLQSWVGPSGTVLKWFQSFLSDSKYVVRLGEFLSSIASLPCGLPQGSILAPLYFHYICYLWDLFSENMGCRFTFIPMILKSIYLLEK